MCEARKTLQGVHADELLEGPGPGFVDQLQPPAKPFRASRIIRTNSHPGAWPVRKGKWASPVRCIYPLLDQGGSHGLLVGPPLVVQDG